MKETSTQAVATLKIYCLCLEYDVGEDWFERNWLFPSKIKKENSRITRRIES